MNSNDDKLKQALAKMLPEELEWLEIDPQWNFISTLKWKRDAQIILDTELLHLCSLAQEGMEKLDRFRYVNALSKIITGNDHACPAFELLSATWQQRTEALAKVKENESGNETR